MGINLKSGKKGVSLVIVAMGMMGLLIFSSFVVDAGLFFVTQLELQKAVEVAALAGASSLEPVARDGTVSINTSVAKNVAIRSFNQMKDANPRISNATIIDGGPLIRGESKAIRIKARATPKTHFAALIGIKKVRVEAEAAALSAPYFLDNNLPRIKNGTSLYKGSVIAGDKDTKFEKSVVFNTNNSDHTNIYNTPDNKGISLGPGGYITIKLPFPLVDRYGSDLYIRELGNLEGYYVFAGNNINPAKPYINSDEPGDGISWRNISCTGIPANAPRDSMVGAYYTDVNVNGTVRTEAKFYGSGYFDLGRSCKKGNDTYNSSLKSAEYIKIVDDNREDGFVIDFPNVPALLPGEHSSITPGADIDAIAVLHHTRLIKPSDFFLDSDNDGLIDFLEINILHTSISNSDHDGDGITDAQEYAGWYVDGTTPLSIVDRPSKTVYFTNPANQETDKIGFILYP